MEEVLLLRIKGSPVLVKFFVLSRPQGTVSATTMESASYDGQEPPRLRFRVELKEGQTNVICMKELLQMAAMKDSAEAGAATTLKSPSERTSHVLSTQTQLQHHTTSGVHRYQSVIDRIAKCD